MQGLDNALHMFLSNRVTVYLYVFSPFVKSRVRCKINSGLIVTIQRNRLRMLNTKVFKQIQKPNNLKQVCTMARYSDSAEDLETVFYFFDRQDKRESPKNVHKPVTDCLESEQVAQSASEKALSSNEDVEGKSSLFPTVPLM